MMDVDADMAPDMLDMSELEDMGQVVDMPDDMAGQVEDMGDEAAD
jgi:hypothetical protein